jgi:hypothetical protein
MAEPVLSTTDAKAKKEAKVAAIKQSMGGITKLKEEEAAVAGQQVGKLQQAFGKQEGATKLGIQSQLAQQLAQQEGMGGGYNKAAARQAAATAGTQSGLALGQVGVQAAKEVGGSEMGAAAAKTEAAAQLYEQLTGEQKLEKEAKEGGQAAATNLSTEIANKIAETSYAFDDDEEAAITNLKALYGTYKQDFAENPEQAKLLAQRIAGIMKDAGLASDYAKATEDPEIKAIFDAAGYTSEMYEKEAEYDY